MCVCVCIYTHKKLPNYIYLIRNGWSSKIFFVFSGCKSLLDAFTAQNLVVRGNIQALICSRKWLVQYIY